MGGHRLSHRGVHTLPHALQGTEVAVFAGWSSQRWRLHPWGGCLLFLSPLAWPKLCRFQGEEGMIKEGCREAQWRRGVEEGWSQELTAKGNLGAAPLRWWEVTTH